MKKSDVNARTCLHNQESAVGLLRSRIIQAGTLLHSTTVARPSR